jgi:hypothetical protein
MRDGDLDLSTMDLNGKHVKRITNTLGYDGGACSVRMERKLSGSLQAKKPRKK